YRSISCRATAQRRFRRERSVRTQVRRSNSFQLISSDAALVPGKRRCITTLPRGGTNSLWLNRRLKIKLFDEKTRGRPVYRATVAGPAEYLAPHDRDD